MQHHVSTANKYTDLQPCLNLFSFTKLQDQRDIWEVQHTGKDASLHE